MSNLVIAINGERVRAFLKTPRDPDNPESPIHFKELSLKESLASPRAGIHSPTDMAGRFEKGNRIDQPQGFAAGEQHHADQEWEKRQALALANSVSQIVEEQGVISWMLVAPSKWIKPFEQGLSESAREGLQKSESGDWTGMDLAQIERRVIV